MINTLDSKKKNFYSDISSLSLFAGENTDNVSTSVAEIISDIENKGDEKLLELTNLHDRRNEVSVESLIVEKKSLETAAMLVKINVSNISAVFANV